MPTVKVNDIEMYYEQHGQGEELLLITGLNGSHLMWANVLPKLSKNYHVTIIDNRGAGLTSAPKGPYSITQMADDTAALMDAIGLEQAHVVGHSMGGAIAQQLAIRHPEKLKKLILYATSSKFDPRCIFAVELTLYLQKQGASPQDIARLVSIPYCFSKQFIAEPNNIESFYKLADENPYPMNHDASIAQTDACRNHNTRELLSNIQAWTLVISPEQDILTPPCDGQYMAARIPNARFMEIKDYAHCWHLEAPDYFCDQVHLYIGRKNV